MAWDRILDSIFIGGLRRIDGEECLCVVLALDVNSNLLPIIHCLDHAEEQWLTSRHATLSD